jgi:hypothetical protein
MCAIEWGRGLAQAIGAYDTQGVEEVTRPLLEARATHAWIYTHISQTRRFFGFLLFLEFSHSLSLLFIGIQYEKSPSSANLFPSNQWRPRLF